MVLFVAAAAALLLLLFVVCCDSVLLAVRLVWLLSREGSGSSKSCENDSSTLARNAALSLRPTCVARGFFVLTSLRLR